MVKGVTLAVTCRFCVRGLRLYFYTTYDVIHSMREELHSLHVVCNENMLFLRGYEYESTELLFSLDS